MYHIHTDIVHAKVPVRADQVNPVFSAFRASTNR